MALNSSLSWSTISQQITAWEAPTISIPELWRPGMIQLWRIFSQQPKARPNNLCVYGNTNSGKTTWLREIIPSLKEHEKLTRFGIVEISCQTNATLKGLYEQLLDELQWPYTKSDNIQRLEKSLRPAFKERNTKLLVIDEFSQLQNAFKDNQLYEVLKALRNIPQWTNRPIVIVGTPIILDILAKDNDTNNRFAKFEFPRFELINGKWKVLRDVLRTLDENLYQTTGIKSVIGTSIKPELIEYLFSKSKGKIGSLIKIYEKAVEYSLDSVDKNLNADHFYHAIKELDKDSRFFDPHSLSVEITEKWWLE